MSVDDSPIDYPAKEEVDVLLGALSEYTDSLNNRIDTIESIRQQVFSLISIVSFAFPAFIVVSDRYSLPRMVNDSEIWAIPFVLAFSIGIAVFFLLLLSLANRFRRSIMEARRIQNLLSEIVRRGSQLRDARNFGFAQKLYVDVRLKDAESTLSLSYRVTKRGILPRIFSMRLEK